MKILCISTLDKFSRFYLDIKKQLEGSTDEEIDLKIFSIHLSGFLYTVLRLKFSCLISMKSWLLANRKRQFYTEIIEKTERYKGVNYKECISFHERLNKNNSKQALLRQALAYIDIFESIFKKEKPDYLITIGDSRLSIEIAVALAKLHDIKVYFIEQGSFNTTFFDAVGVNANMSIRTNLKILEPSGLNFDIRHSSKKYNRSPLYRGLDILLMWLFEGTILYPPDLKYTDLNSYRSKRSSVKNANIKMDTKQPMFLLILQVPLDVNMIKHSPNFSSHAEILKSVHSNLPQHTTLVIREHPLYVNKYESSFYDYVNKNNILIDNSTSLENALELAQVVIVNNSSVGIEAILKYKTVVVLGNAFYDRSSICLKLESKTELAQVLKNAVDYRVNTKQIDNFKQLLLSTVMLKGAITDKDLNSAKLIANHLLANH